MRYRICVKAALALLSAFLLLTCKEKSAVPQPQLNVSFYSQAEPAGYYPIKITFTNTSESADEYQWAFGNGKISSEASPVVEYFSSGLFPVTLTIKKGVTTKSITQKVSVPFKRLSVALIYFIPKDGTFDQAIFSAIQRANPLIQGWYDQQLGGKTYGVSVPVVDTIQGSRSSSDYGGESDNLLKSIESEVYGKLGSRIVKNEQVVLVFYPIITTSFGGIGTVIKNQGEERRIGIIGGTACRSITKSSAKDQSYGLWTVAHELGHALGLSHNLRANSLMFGPVDNTGYIPPNIEIPSFPDCQLTQNDKIILGKSPFLR
jgi:hypothetical protein